MLHIKIDGLDVLTETELSVLQAAQSVGVSIPDLCAFATEKEIYDCPLCVVEVEGVDHLLPACKTKIWNEMVICTDNPRIRHARKVSMMFLESGLGCQACSRQSECSFPCEMENDGSFRSIPPPLCCT